jgi:hypothetical protein
MYCTSPVHFAIVLNCFCEVLNSLQSSFRASFAHQIRIPVPSLSLLSFGTHNYSPFSADGLRSEQADGVNAPDGPGLPSSYSIYLSV